MFFSAPRSFLAFCVALGTFLFVPKITHAMEELSPFDLPDLGDCLDELSTGRKTDTKDDDLPKFDFDVFSTEKDQYKTLLLDLTSKIPPGTPRENDRIFIPPDLRVAAIKRRPKTIEARLAFLEASLDHYGRSGLKWGLRKVMEEGSHGKRKKMMKSLTKFNPDKGVEAFQLRTMVDEFYALVHSDDEGRLSRLLSKKKQIRRRVETDIARFGLTEAVSHLGFLLDSTALDRFNNFRSDNAVIEKMIAGTALSLSINYAFHQMGYPILLPMWIPGVNILFGMRSIPFFTDDLYELVCDKGFDAAYPALVKKFGYEAISDVAFQAGERVYVILRVLFTAWGLYTIYPWLRLSTSATQVDFTQLQSLEAQTWAMESVSNESYQREMIAWESEWKSKHPHFTEFAYTQARNEILYELRFQVDHTVMVMELQRRLEDWAKAWKKIHPRATPEDFESEKEKIKESLVRQIRYDMAKIERTRPPTDFPSPAQSH